MTRRSPPSRRRGTRRTRRMMVGVSPGRPRSRHPTLRQLRVRQLGRCRAEVGRPPEPAVVGAGVDGVGVAFRHADRRDRSVLVRVERSCSPSAGSGPINRSTGAIVVHVARGSSSARGRCSRGRACSAWSGRGRAARRAYSAGRCRGAEGQADAPGHPVLRHGRARRACERERRRERDAGAASAGRAHGGERDRSPGWPRSCRSSASVQLRGRSTLCSLTFVAPGRPRPAQRRSWSC